MIFRSTPFSGPPLLFHPLFLSPKIGVIFVFRFFRPEPSLWTPLVPHHSRPPQGCQVAESISHPNGKVGKSSTQNCLSGKGLWLVPRWPFNATWKFGEENFQTLEDQEHPRVFTWKYLDFSKLLHLGHPYQSQQCGTSVPGVGGNS